MVSDGFAGLLKSRRSPFNAAVAAVRSRSGGFDTAELNRFLSQTEDLLWTALRGADESRAGAAGDALFDMALTLVEHRWTGASGRSPLVEQLWRSVGRRTEGRARSSSRTVSTSACCCSATAPATGAGLRRSAANG